MNKKFLIPTLAAVILSVGVLSTSTIKAQDAGNPDQGLITKLAQKLGLEETKVQTAFDEARTEMRTERQAEMETKFEEQVNQLLADGKITEAQKTAILAKHEEMQSQMQNRKPENKEGWQNITQEEKQAQAETRRAEMEQRRTDLENWANTNGLNLEELGLFVGGPHGDGKGIGPREGGMGMPMEKPTETQTTTE